MDELFGNSEANFKNQEETKWALKNNSSKSLLSTQNVTLTIEGCPEDS